MAAGRVTHAVRHAVLQLQLRQIEESEAKTSHTPRHARHTAAAEW
jgi:hypothetical protein